MSGDHGPLHTAPTNIRHPFYGRPPRIEQQRGETSDQWRSRAHADVVAALMEAIGPHVELGDHDRRIVEWLADWDTSVVGTIASLLRRVRAAGETERGAAEEPRVPHFWRDVDGSRWEERADGLLHCLDDGDETDHARGTLVAISERYGPLTKTMTAVSPAPAEPREDGTDPGSDRALLIEVIRYLADGGSSSVSTIQRKFHLWYAKAANLLVLAESWGVVGPAQGSLARHVLLSSRAEFQDVIDRIEHPMLTDDEAAIKRMARAMWQSETWNPDTHLLGDWLLAARAALAALRGQR